MKKEVCKGGSCGGKSFQSFHLKYRLGSLWRGMFLYPFSHSRRFLLVFGLLLFGGLATFPAYCQERCRGLALKEQILKFSESIPDSDFARAVSVVAWQFRPCFGNWCRCDTAGFERDLKAVIFENLSEKNLFVYGALKNENP